MSSRYCLQGSSALVAAALALNPVAALASGEEEDGSPHVLMGATAGESIGFVFEGIDPDPTSGALVIPIDIFGDPLTSFALGFPSGVTGFQSEPFEAERDLAFEAPAADGDADELAELAEEGLTPLPASSEIALVADALGDDFIIFLAQLPGSGLNDLLDDTGLAAALPLGSTGFDTHPTYILETTDLSLGQTTSGTFRLIDSSGGLSSSDPFTITLEVVPEPSTATLAMAGTALLLRRRRARA